MFTLTIVFLVLILTTQVVNARREIKLDHIKIVHLGDSYSSGSGFNIDDDGWYGPRWCFRHSNAWGHQAVGIVQRSHSVHLNYTNHACQGARIEHLLQPYTQKQQCSVVTESSDPQYTQKKLFWFGNECEHTMQPQIDNIDDSADIVIATIGGNNAYFSDIIMSCFTPSISLLTSDCEEVCEYSKRYLEGQLTSKECSDIISNTKWDTSCSFEDVYISILEKITSKMKEGSKVIISAYPYIATDTEDEHNKMVRELGYIAIQRQKEAIDYVNTLLHASNRDVEIILFTDHVKLFAGHEATTDGMPNPDGYLNEFTPSSLLPSVGLSETKLPFGLSLNRPTVSSPELDVEADELAQLYHPNRAG